MKWFTLTLILTACSATAPAPHVTIDPPDCRYSRFQSAQLAQAIKLYETTNDDDYAYYQQLKNNLWSLRSGCVNMRDS